MPQGRYPTKIKRDGLMMLGYPSLWFEFGHLSESFLKEQLAALAEDADPRPEWYRYRAFRRFLDDHPVLTDEEFQQVTALIQVEPRPMGAINAMAALIRHPGLSDGQLAQLKTRSSAASRVLQGLIDREMGRRGMTVSEHDAMDAVRADPAIRRSAV